MAVTVSFGKCAKCSENNAMTNSACRKCNADLPWSKQNKAAVKAASVKSPRAGAPRGVTKSAVKMPEVDGMLLFMVFIAFAMPVIGYFVWRSYSEDGSEYTTAIGWAASVGLVAHILRALA
jgi:hypothetical protein